MAPKFELFTKLHLNKGFKNMFELLQSCAQPSICCEYFRMAQVVVCPPLDQEFVGLFSSGYLPKTF